MILIKYKLLPVFLVVYINIKMIISVIAMLLTITILFSYASKYQIWANLNIRLILYFLIFYLLNGHKVILLSTSDMIFFFSFLLRSLNIAYCCPSGIKNKAAIYQYNSTRIFKYFFMNWGRDPAL